jgi:cytoskeletal protein CcmA (bactofilin family)
VINEQDFKNFHYNMLGQKSSFTGELVLYGDSVITSEINGNIIVQDSGKLVLERGCRIRGKIQAIDIEIFGEVEGEIEASGLVSIRSSAQVTGTIKSGRLVIYPGAIVESKASSSQE